MNLQKAIRLDKYQQSKIKDKQPITNLRIPPNWNKTKWIQDECLYEQIGNRWYLMKEGFYEGHH